MALVTCPDCGNQISDAAPACPRCGRPATLMAPQQHAPPPQGPAPGYAQPAVVERLLFQDAMVTVTNVRAVFSATNTTLAMSNVTSVRAFIEPRPPSFLMLGFMLVGVGLFCVKVDVADSSSVGTIGLILGGALILGYFLNKPKHWVRIGTAGAEANAIWSHDPRWTQTVVNAMNEAILRRG